MSQYNLALLMFENITFEFNLLLPEIIWDFDKKKYFCLIHIVILELNSTFILLMKINFKLLIYYKII